MRDFLARGLLPKDFAGIAVEAQNRELVDFGRFLSAAESAATASATGTTWLARPARPAELRTREGGVQAFTELVASERAALVGVPFSEPLRESAVELFPREGAVLVDVGGVEE